MSAVTWTNATPRALAQAMCSGFEAAEMLLDRDRVKRRVTSPVALKRKLALRQTSPPAR